jgi:outer membrane protein assembly factor BamB
LQPKLKAMKNQTNRWLGLPFLMILAAVLVFPACDIFDDIKDDPPEPTADLGEVLWTHEMTGRDSFLTGPHLALDEARNQLYYAKAGGTLYWTPARVVAVNTEDGTQVWESPPVDNTGLNSDIVIGNDGTIYAIGSHRLYAINPLNGQFDWIWEVPETLTAPDGDGEVNTYGAINELTLTEDGSLLLASGARGGHYHRALFNVSPAGVMNWGSTRAVYGGGVVGLVAGANDRCYFISNPYPVAQEGLHLSAADVRTGALLWHTKVYSWGSSLNNIIFDADGNLIVSMSIADGAPYHIHRVDAETGAIIGSSAEEASSNLKLMGPDGTIYQFQNPTGIMTYAAGDLSARPFEGRSVHMQGALINAKNQFVVIHDQGRVSHVNVYEPSGMLDWSGELANMETRRLILSSDGIYYGIISGEGVFAMQGESRLATSGWPRIGHDNHNTSQEAY